MHQRRAVRGAGEALNIKKNKQPKKTIDFEGRSSGTWGHRD